MELLCIETHPKKVVIAGLTYPFISDKMSCGCRDCFDVGIKYNYTKPFVICTTCGGSYIADDIWWLRKTRFVEIATKEEELTIEEKQFKEELI